MQTTPNIIPQNTTDYQQIITNANHYYKNTTHSTLYKTKLNHNLKIATPYATAVYCDMLCKS